jgi:preprotein translocase SecF subunit
MPILRLLKAQPSFPFMKHGKIAMLCSVLLSIATFALLATKGLNLGIDFAGGVIIEIKTKEVQDLGQMRTKLSEAKYGSVSLQYFGNEHEILIRTSGDSNKAQGEVAEAIKQQLIAKLGADNVEFRRIDYVGATVGAEMLNDGLLALGIAFIAMLFYIWLRFEWQFGIGGLLALLHDSILVIGFYAVTGYEFGLTAIAALLTVIGYSINDSVVIFDRIRDIMRKTNYNSLSEVIDLSLNQTLSRTLLTGVTTLLAAGSLGVLGGEAIESFAYALCFGVLVGTYSSIYISAPSLIYFNLSLKAFEKPTDDLPNQKIVRG